MNRHHRRAAAAGNNFAIIPDLDLMQIKVGNKNLTFAPLELRSYFTVTVLEHAHEQPIDDATFEIDKNVHRRQLTSGQKRWLSKNWQHFQRDRPVQSEIPASRQPELSPKQLKGHPDADQTG